MTTLRCIYCLLAKPASAFAASEHVIPQSFGRFENNLTLVHLVCDECNQYFGGTLDLQLARDSLEGVDRFTQGVRPWGDYKSVGKSSRIQRRIAEGPWKGALAYVEPTADGAGLQVRPVAQIGFMHRETGEFRYHSLDALPARDDLGRDGYDLTVPNCFRIIGCDADEAVARARERGIVIGLGPPVGMDSSQGSVLARVEATVDQVVRRAIGKISFNYLAYWEGDFALQECFEPIRRFVRHGEEADVDLVSVTQESILADEAVVGLRRLGHVITLNWTKDGRSIVGQVSLMNLFKYSVCLAPGDAPGSVES